MTYRILQTKGKLDRHSRAQAQLDMGASPSDHLVLAGKWRMEHWAWLCLFFNLIRLLPRGHDVTGLDPHSVYRILLVVIASVLVTLSLVANTRSTASFFRSPLFFLFIYSLVAVGSSLIASVEFYSLWKAVEVLVLTGCVGALLALPSADRVAQKTYRITILLVGALCFTPWLSALIDPSDAFRPQPGLIPVMLSGLLPPLNPNTVGFMASVTSLLLTIRFCRHRNKRAMFGSLLIIALITLVLSNSRTGLAAYILGLLAYSFADGRKYMAIVVLAAGSLVVAVGPVRDTAVQYLQRGQHIESIKTLSGRTVIWKEAIGYFVKSPYVGHGFGSAGRFDLLSNAGSHLHGTIFEVMVGVGLLGLVPWVLWIALTGILLFKAWREAKIGYPAGAQSMIAEWIGVFVILIIRSSTSSGLYAHNVETMLFCSIMMLLMAGASRAGDGHAGGNAEKTFGMTLRAAKHFKPYVSSSK